MISRKTRLESEKISFIYNLPRTVLEHFMRNIGLYLFSIVLGFLITSIMFLVWMISRLVI